MHRHQPLSKQATKRDYTTDISRPTSQRTTKQIAQHILVEQAQQELTGANVALVSARSKCCYGKLE